MHPHLPGPRPLAVPGIGFPQNISIASDVLDPAAFGDLLDNHRGASTRPIDRIVWLPCYGNGLRSNREIVGRSRLISEQFRSAPRTG